MTSIAFITGLAPLVWAAGASEIARRSVSTTVFVGMLAASAIVYGPHALRRVRGSAGHGGNRKPCRRPTRQNDPAIRMQGLTLSEPA